MSPSLNETWEQHIKGKGADFVYFIDTSALPVDSIEGYSSVVLFGKALSKEYINALRDEEKPKTKEVINTERKMDNLAIKVADLLEAEGYNSIAKLKFGHLPHKTVALNAGLGFIGKNNLLVTEQYGCAVMFGKVLTTAPFITMSKEPIQPKCGDCSICVNVCPTKTLRGTTWSITTKRDDMMIRKLCTLCLKCMIWCPYTEKYGRFLIENALVDKIF
jgi:epoxyqueuosine reductase QueG